MDKQVDSKRLDDARMQALDDEYRRLYDDGLSGGAGSKYLRMFERLKDGLWRDFMVRPHLFSNPVADSVVLDFGCKFGQVTPILKALGAAQVISVDVDDEYLRDGARFVGSRYGSIHLKSDECYVDVESNSVDLVFASEVISHIHPALLYTFYEEMARVLTPGGEILIGDANNIAHLPTRLERVENYREWEQGSSAELGSNYLRQRRKLLEKNFRELDDERLDYFARNCSGLHSKRLLATVRRALETGEFTERPYRPGQVPVHPSYGVMMERGFHPLQVEIALAEHGIAAMQISEEEDGRPLASEAERGASELFIVRGRKLPETLEARLEFARNGHPAGR